MNEPHIYVKKAECTQILEHAKAMKTRDSSLWSPQNLVMGCVVAMLSWGGVELFEVNEAIAVQQTKQVVDDRINESVRELLPSINSTLIEVQCMLRYPSTDTASRLACITDN